MQIDTRTHQPEAEDEMDAYADNLLNDLESEFVNQQSEYVQEYEDVINAISNVCKQIASKSHLVDEAFVIELCPRIWALAIEHK